MTGEVIGSSKGPLCVRARATRRAGSRRCKEGRQHPRRWRWNARGRQMGSNGARKRAKIGYDYIHSAVDDPSRLAYSEVLPDEKGHTCAGFILRAADYLAARGITRVERVITDNRLCYRNSCDVRDAIVTLGAKHKCIRPHCPWQNGKVSASTG